MYAVQFEYATVNVEILCANDGSIETILPALYVSSNLSPCRVAENPASTSSSNAWAPSAGRRQFEDCIYLVGQEIADDLATPNPKCSLEVRGFVDRMNATSPWEPVYLFIACAGGAGPVEQGFLEELLSRARRSLTTVDSIDAVYIAGHGAAVGTEDPEPDATLFETVRTCVGSNVPIVVTLDLHALVRARPGAFGPNLTAPLEGVQFHPESFLTLEGPRLLANFSGSAGRPTGAGGVSYPTATRRGSLCHCGIPARLVIPILALKWRDSGGERRSLVCCINPQALLLLSERETNSHGGSSFKITTKPSASPAQPPRTSSSGRIANWPASFTPTSTRKKGRRRSSSRSPRRTRCSATRTNANDMTSWARIGRPGRSSVRRRGGRVSGSVVGGRVPGVERRAAVRGGRRFTLRAGTSAISSSHSSAAAVAGAAGGSVVPGARAKFRAGRLRRVCRPWQEAAECLRTRGRTDGDVGGSRPRVMSRARSPCDRRRASRARSRSRFRLVRPTE